jgi:hypothetical protein
MMKVSDDVVFVLALIFAGAFFFAVVVVALHFIMKFW